MQKNLSILVYSVLVFIFLRNDLRKGRHILSEFNFACSTFSRECMNDTMIAFAGFYYLFAKTGLFY